MTTLRDQDQDQTGRDQDQGGQDQDQQGRDQDQDLKKVVLIGLEAKTRSRDPHPWQQICASPFLSQIKPVNNFQEQLLREIWFHPRTVLKFALQLAASCQASMYTPHTAKEQEAQLLLTTGSTRL